MEYMLAGLLSFLLSFILIRWVDSKKKISKGKVIYKQSDTHKFLKEFFSRDISSKPKKSQLKSREEKKATKIVVTEDDKAYWVIDNIFYVCDVINGRPNFDTTKPIDTTNMSKKELDKMLFILDNLGRGDKNELGGSGN